MKKLVIIFTTTTVALALLYFSLFWAPSPKGLHPHLRWNIASPLEVKKNNQWTLNVDSKKQQLKLISASGVTQFSTAPGMAFVGGSFDTVTAHEHRGSFSFSHDISSPCEIQTVDTVDEQWDYAEVGGLLFCGKKNYPWSLKFYTQNPQTIKLELTLDPQLKRANLHFETHKDESFFGGGAQFTHFSLKGHAIPLWVSEQGIGRGLQPLTFIMNLLARSGGHSYSTYFSSGAFISSKRRGLVVHSFPRTIVDFKNDNYITIDHWSPEIKLSLSYADSVKELLKHQSSITGRIRPLPDWFHKGAILGVQGGQELALEKLNKVLDAGAKISGLWIQDWVGQRKTSIGKQLWWDWNLDTDHFPNWESFRRDVQSLGIELLGYINPMLVEVPSGKTSRNLLAEAMQKDYLVKTSKGQPLEIGITSFSAHLVDLTHPAARNWLLQILKDRFLSLGFKGWMADFGEALPTNVQLKNQKGKDFHNQYSDDWVLLNRELADSKETPDDLVFFNRTGFTHTPAHSTMFWLGDQMVSWDVLDGLHSSLIALLSSGVSGATLNHSDVGGYTSIDVPLIRFMRSEELLIRWMELNTFTAAFRTHEGNLPDKSLQVFSNENLLKSFSHFSHVFAELFNYRKDVLKEASEQGIPVVRPLWLEVPGETIAWTIDSQFFFGSDILIAPILEPKTSARKFWLPPGEWVHMFTRKKFLAKEGGLWLELDAPLGQPLVLINGASKWIDRWHFEPLHSTTKVESRSRFKNTLVTKSHLAK